MGFSYFTASCRKALEIPPSFQVEHHERVESYPRTGSRGPAVGGNHWQESPGGYLAINYLGSLSGPVVAGAAMDRFGRSALFMAGAGAVVLVLVIWGVLNLRRSRRPGSGSAPWPVARARGTCPAQFNAAFVARLETSL